MSTDGTKRRKTTVVSTKRKTISESPVRTSSTKRTKRTSSKLAAPASSSKKTPTKRKPSTTRARSASASRSHKKSKKAEEEEEEEDDGEENDEDMEEGEEQHPSSTSSGGGNSVLSSLQSHLSGAAQAVRDEVEHLLPSVKDKVAGAKKSMDQVKDRAMHAYSDAKDSVKRSTTSSTSSKGKKKKGGDDEGEEEEDDEEDEDEDEDEEEEEEEDEKSSRPTRRRSTPAAVRHSSRTSTKISSKATEGLQRSRRGAASGGSHDADGGDGGEVTVRKGVELRTHKADVSHLTQYHPDGTVIQSWRDVGQIAPHLVLHFLLIVFLHFFIASVAHDDFKFKAYELIRPRTLRNFFFPVGVYHLAMDTLKRFSLHYPLVLGLFFSSLYFFRASVRSVLLRHADTTIKDCDYHSGALTAYYSRFVYGVVHMAFIAFYWHYYAHSHNVLDLGVLFWINTAYWAQDALANAVYRSQSQTSLQATAYFLLCCLSLAFASIDTPVPTWFGSWTALVKPFATFLLIVSVFVSSLLSASQFIHAHSDFDRGLKAALWGFVFVVYIPLSVAGVLVPALASVSDLEWHHLFPAWLHRREHAKYTHSPHTRGDPAA